jgi:hypothetical protein
VHVLVFCECTCVPGYLTHVAHLFGCYTAAACRFSDVHGFDKPNDKRALDLMNECAKVGGLAAS